MAATPLRSFPKDPDAVLDYGVRWRRWLKGDSINSAVWTVPAGLTLVAETYGGDTAMVWLSGGVDGTSYLCSVRIVTAGGRTDDRTIQILVRAR